MRVRKFNWSKKTCEVELNNHTIASVPIEDAAPAASEQPPRIVLGATRSQSQVNHSHLIFWMILNLYWTR